MDVEFIRKLLKAQPFVPFEVRLMNGEAHLVKHPEQVLVAGMRMFIYYPESDNVEICSLLHVANISMSHLAA